MPIAKVDGQPVHYRDSGEGGPTVLFAHGFLMDNTMFDPQVEALAPDYRCVRFDARGFGETPAAGPFTYWDLADDAVGVLDRLGVDDAVLFGMSQGGYLALRAALRHPRRVRALVLMDTQAGPDDEETRGGYRQAFDAWMTHGPQEEVLEQMADQILGDHPELRRRWMRRWREMPESGLRHPVECILGRDDVSGRLGEIECPALLVHGEEDVAIPVREAEKLDGALRGSVGIVRVPGARHAPGLTHPEAVNPPVRAFLDTYA